MKSAMRSWQWLALLLSACCLWVFAHELVVQKINQRISSQITSLEEGSLNQLWDVNETKDVVSFFNSHKNAQGKWYGKQFSVSLTMPKWPINPNLHDQFNISFDDQSNQPATLALETSTLEAGVFYTAQLNLLAGQHQIQLSNLQWKDLNNNEIQWSDIPKVATWVVRLFSTKETTWEIHSMQFKQSVEIKTNIQWQPAECLTPKTNGSSIMNCNINNTIVKLDHEMNQSNYQQNIRFTQWTTWPYQIWFVLFIFLLTTAVYRFKVLMLGIWGMVMLATAALLLLPDGYRISIWLLLPLVILVFWLRRKWWLRLGKVSVELSVLVFFVTLIFWWYGNFSWGFIIDWPQYFVWAMLQQTLMAMIFEWNKEHSTLRNIDNILITALLFSLFHVPNHLLMILTFTGGVFWMWLWSRYKNLWLMSLSHSLWALMLYQAVGEKWLHSARVGLSFL